MNESECYLRELRQGLPVFGRRRILAEIRHHLEAAIADEKDRGLSDQEAERLVIERLGPAAILVDRFTDDQTRGARGLPNRLVAAMPTKPILAVLTICLAFAVVGVAVFSATETSPSAKPGSPFTPEVIAGVNHSWGPISRLTSRSITVGSTSCTLGPSSPRTTGLSHAPATTKFIASCTHGILSGIMPSPQTLQNVVVMNNVRTVTQRVSGTPLQSGCNYKMPTILKATGLPLLGDRLATYDLATCTGVAEIGARSAIGQGVRVSITVHSH